MEHGGAQRKPKRIAQGDVEHLHPPLLMTGRGEEMKAQEEGDEGGEEEERRPGCLIDYSINIIWRSDLVYLKLRVCAVCMLKSWFTHQCSISQSPG